MHERHNGACEHNRGNSLCGDIRSSVRKFTSDCAVYGNTRFIDNGNSVYVHRTDSIVCFKE